MAASARQRVKAALLRVLGGTVTCERCGRPLFRGLAIVREGGVRVLGADRTVVRVDWATQSRLVFRHAHLDECPPR